MYISVVNFKNTRIHFKDIYIYIYVFKDIYIYIYIYIYIFEKCILHKNDLQICLLYFSGIPGAEYLLIMNIFSSARSKLNTERFKNSYTV